MSIVKCGCIINIALPDGSILEFFKRTDNRLSVRITGLDGHFEGETMVEREAKELRDGLLELYPLDN